MRKLRITAVPVAMAAVMALAAGPAFAGEITGKGKPTAGPAHAASECVFSGFNDDDLPTDAVAQSFGQIVKVAGPQGGVPGFACNPTRSPRG
jgi:hypothetical protein